MAKDEAFCFLYKDNLELLEKMGGKICYFSPLHDAHLPANLDGLLLCGGYPELFGKELEKGESIRQEIKKSSGTRTAGSGRMRRLYVPSRYL
nr:hypothetical protein [Blautia argi]